jgi:hypothetical protein
MIERIEAWCSDKRSLPYEAEGQRPSAPPRIYMQFFRIESLGIFMLDHPLALRLRLGPWAASGEDSS